MYVYMSNVKFTGTIGRTMDQTEYLYDTKET